ncbi:MAG: class I SAM-dependent methyltransferase [Anaerolineae bacterium]|nr:class I SAM-dependent methyltransferase [Anaerolineae bacterium]
MHASRQPEMMSYFDIQAYTGATKHMGGFAATQMLITLCHIDSQTRVLDVGCGAGATSCYLAKTYRCRVVGVDLHAGMIASARARAAREGVTDLVAFRAADVLALPFDAGAFDVVLCESVLTFVAEKAAAIQELVRVTKPGGRVGLNEEIWLQSPTETLKQYAIETWNIAQPEIATVADWTRWLEAAGLRDLVVKSLRYETRREATQLKRYRLGDMVRMLWRTLHLYLARPAFRDYIKARKMVPKQLFDYLGYALFSGCKLNHR